MNKAFVTRFDAAREALRAKFSEKEPEEYIDIVRAVVSILHAEDDYDSPSADRVHEVDDGDYQGTKVYVIGGSGYQPHNYWYLRVDYGSCSGCDTLQSIHSHRDYENPAPTETQLDDYMKLALHVVQEIRPMVEEESDSL